MPEQRWKPVPGWPCYSVSDRGYVRRREKMPGTRARVGREVEQSFQKDGYLKVTLYHDSEQATLQVHRLVLEAFVGPAPGPGYHAAHRNNDGTDNRLSNLCWMTAAENAAHRLEHGIVLRGADNPNAKLTERDVVMIRLSRDLGQSVAKIATEFKVHQSTIYDVIRGRVWKHVPSIDIDKVKELME